MGIVKISEKDSKAVNANAINLKSISSDKLNWYRLLTILRC